MLTALTSAVALVVSLAVTPLVRLFAIRYGLLDQPDAERKIHEFPVPRLGGVAIAIAFAVALAFAAVATNDLNAIGVLRPNRAPAILAGAALLVVVGVIDDVRGMPALVKLFWQVVAAVLAFALGLSLDRLHLPWGIVHLGWLALPLTVAWIVLIINAINLIDGLDGLAAGVVLTALGAFALLVGVGRGRSDAADHRRRRAAPPSASSPTTCIPPRSSWATPGRCSSASSSARSPSR